MEKRNTMSGDIMREVVIATLKFYLLFSPFTVTGCDKDLRWGGLREEGREGEREGGRDGRREGARKGGREGHLYTSILITHVQLLLLAIPNVMNGSDHSLHHDLQYIYIMVTSFSRP